MNCRVDKGNAIVPAVIVILAVVAIAIVVVSGGLNYYTRERDHRIPIPPDACPCNTTEDRQDMEKRLAEAEAAANDLNTDLIPDAPSGKAFSGDEKESKGVRQIGEAMGGEKAGVHKVAGTSPACITWTSKDKPACIRWALQTHENVHAEACDKYIAGGGKGDWKAAGTMAAYYREDARAYQAEIDFLKSKLAKCPPVLGNYPGAQSKEEQQQRLAGSKRRATQYVAGLPS